MEIVKMKELKNGDVNMTIEMNAEEEALMIQIAIISILREYMTTEIKKSRKKSKRKIIRYDYGGPVGMKIEKKGFYVRYSDYERLRRRKNKGL